MSTVTRRPYAARLPPKQRKAQLLDAALTLILRDGYGGVSIEAIAAEAGVTRPVVYGVYRGLGPLLSDLLDRQQARALAQLFEVLPEELWLQDAATVFDVVERLGRRVVADPATWRPILAAGPGMPVAVWERIDADKARLRRQLTLILERSRADLGLAPQLDAEALAHACVALAEHFGRLLLEDEEFGSERVMRALRGLLPPGRGAMRPVPG